MEKLLLSIEETAELLGVGRSLLYQMLVRGDIESLKIGRRRVVPSAAVEAFVERLREEQAWVSDAERNQPVLNSLRAGGHE